MDPLSQGVVGVSVTQVVASRSEKVSAAAFGFFAGMAADLDVLIDSSVDPLLNLEYHRQFTHSLVFVPVGALLCALVLWPVLRFCFSHKQLSFARAYLFCFLGYMTHALLDACTTYGTQLLWPFSSARIAWNNVSVIDPLFTLPLLILMVAVLLSRTAKVATRLAWFGFGYMFVYLGLGFVQNQRAESVAHQLAQSRSHQPTRLAVKPSFANLLVWKSVYEYDGRYYVDAIRVWAGTKVYSGTSVEKLDTEKHFGWLNIDTQQAKDIERFRWFSNNYLALDPSNKNRIIDVRYSLIPNQVQGMWGITLTPNTGVEQHVQWTTSRPAGAAAASEARKLWSMIAGRD